MGSVVLVADETVAARRDVVYGLFGAGHGAGWLFAADCDVLAVGSVVSLQLPLGGPQGAVDMLGRVTALVPPRQIVITLDQPWRGQLRVGLERIGPESTRVRVRAEVDERGVEWLLRRRGWPARQPADDDGDYRIGLLTSKSGPGAVFAVACENLALMAADELNADGGLHGRRVRLLAADDATDPATGATEARWLLRAGCRVVLARPHSNRQQTASDHDPLPGFQTSLTTLEREICALFQAGKPLSREVGWVWHRGYVRNVTLTARGRLTLDCGFAWRAA